MKNVNWLANRYERIRIMGSGSLGTVYHAIDHLNHQMVALKLVGHTANSQGSSTTHNRALTLAHEFQILASLRHPHIISVLDYGFDAEGRPFYTMQLLDQSDTILRYGQAQPIYRRIQLIIQMLQALAYLHQRGIIHRDIKPANALVDSAGHLRMLDFGLAVLHKHDIGVGVVGTLKYIAPEVLQGEGVTQAADLYAVGVIAYELLTGRYPFPAGNANQLIDEVLTRMPDLSPLRKLTHQNHNDAAGVTQDLTIEEIEATIPLHEALAPVNQSTAHHTTDPDEVDYERNLNDDLLIQIIHRLLVKDPALRYQSADSVIRDLSAAIGTRLPPETRAIRESFLQAAAFVGRKHELDQCKAALKESLRGHGSSWLIIGESGIGKSRLLNEVRVHALVKGATVLIGSRSKSNPTPFDIWRGPLRQLVLSTQLRPKDLSILSDILPDIEQLVGHTVKPLLASNEKHLQARLNRTIARIFQQHQYPIVLLLEDLHEPDINLDPLRLLTEDMRQYPLLIIGTYRCDTKPILPDALQDMNVLSLERLPEPDIAELSASMLGAHVGTQPEVVAMLQRETEGNVSYMIEVLRTLADEAGRLHNIDLVELPEQVVSRSLHDIMAQRIEQLDASILPLLQFAAAMGRQLDLDLLQALAPDHDLDHWLLRCSNAAILDVHDGNWQFNHDKLRLYLLDTLTDEQTQQIHQRIAQTIEQVYAQNLDTQLFRLMIHWHHAANLDKEWQYTQLASQETQSITSFNYAQNLYERALELVAYVDQPPPIIEQAVLYQHLADACSLTGSDNQAEQYYQKALALYQLVDDPRGIAQVMLGLGKFIYNLNQDCTQALIYFENCLQRYRTMDDQQGMATALDYTGRCWMAKGEYDTARDYFEQSLELAETLQDTSRMAQSWQHLGINARFRSDYDTAKRLLESSLTVYESIEDFRGISAALSQLAHIYIMEQKFDVGRHFAYHGLRLALDNGLLPQAVYCLVNFALLKLYRHEVRIALEWISVLCHHPAYSHTMHRDVQFIQQWAAAELLPVEYESIWQRGQHLDFQEVINRILQQHFQHQTLQ